MNDVPQNNVPEVRARMVAEAIADIQAIEERDGVTRDSLENIKYRLIALAAHRELFITPEFSAPEGAENLACLYRLAEGADHRRALYLNLCKPGTATPAHDHQTWSVIVGIRGEEQNKLYERTEYDKVLQVGEVIVAPGSGITFLPDDLHSIHINGPEVTVNFSMYGFGLEQLAERRYYDGDSDSWRHFAAHTDIREARPGRKSSSG